MARTAMAMKTSNASAADGYRTKRCINVNLATPRVERVARDRPEGNAVANATLENQLESAGTSRENGWIVLENAALKHGITVVVDVTSATTYPNNGVELLPHATEGSPGTAPEAGLRGQASLPLQYNFSLVAGPAQLGVRPVRCIDTA